jgi:uncharacterized membrane protein
MIVRRFQLPLLWLVSSFYTFYFPRISNVRSWYLKIFLAFSLSHFCLTKLEHLLTYTFRFHHYRLWCPVYI